MWREPAVRSEGAGVECREVCRLSGTVHVGQTLALSTTGLPPQALQETLSPRTCPRSFHTLLSILGGPGSCLEFLPLLPSCLYGWWPRQGSVGERRPS